jgi:hypothetical protein
MVRMHECKQTYCSVSDCVDTRFVIAAGDIPRDHIYYISEDGGVHGKTFLFLL